MENNYSIVSDAKTQSFLNNVGIEVRGVTAEFALGDGAIGGGGGNGIQDEYLDFQYFEARSQEIGADTAHWIEAVFSNGSISIARLVKQNLRPSTATAATVKAGLLEAKKVNAFVPKAEMNPDETGSVGSECPSDKLDPMTDAEITTINAFKGYPSQKHVLLSLKPHCDVKVLAKKTYYVKSTKRTEAIRMRALNTRVAFHNN